MATSVLLAILLVAGASATERCDPKPDPARSSLADMSFRLNGANLAWPCRSTRNIYMSSGRYLSRNVIATRVQTYKDRAFVTIPRFRTGVPFTLGTFSLKGKNCYTTLAPFPCWSIQEEGNCHALQSAIDLFLDQQEILWVLDIGIVNTMEQPVRRCPPKIVGICVKTGKVIKVIDLSGLVTSASRLQHLIVDYAPSGKAYAYVSDATMRAIIVIDITTNRGFRVVLPKAVAAGASSRDVLYISLIRKSCGNIVYFTYLGSSRLFSIKSSHLIRGQCSGAVVDVGPKPQGHKIVPLGTDNGFNLFFRLKGDSDIYMWNTETCFKSDNWLLAQKGADCRLATQVVPGYKKLMWVIESNFQDYIANKVGCIGASVIFHPLVKDCED